MINELIPFRAAHIDLIDLREGQHIGNYNGNIGLYEDLGPCYTLLIDNKPVVAAGIVNALPKVGECWLIAGKEFEENYIVITKTIKRFFVMVDPFYQRLQMSVKKDFEKASVFAERLGFQKEGTMRKFDVNGEDYLLYARIK